MLPKYAAVLHDLQVQLRDGSELDVIRHPIGEGNLHVADQPHDLKKEHVEADRRENSD
jgi:hypothetical protein